MLESVPQPTIGNLAEIIHNSAKLHFAESGELLEGRALAGQREVNCIISNVLAHTCARVLNGSDNKKRASKKLSTF